MAAEAFQALGQVQRLRIFELLVRHMPDGLAAGEIASTLGVSPSGLSFHLSALQKAGLVTSTRRGRQILNVVATDTTRELVDFLVNQCCHGRPELCMPGGPDTGDREMTDTTYNVLFLCTGNSARSIIAEALLAREGMGRFNAYSAGSQPKGDVHPYALDLLRNLNHDVSGLRSKSWDEFAADGAPKLDFVFTVCDNAANEVCPVWPGQPMTAHWGLPDPAAVTGTEAVVRQAFADTYRMLNNRISILVNLPIETLNRTRLQERLDQMGQMTQSA